MDRNPEPQSEPTQTTSGVEGAGKTPAQAPDTSSVDLILRLQRLGMSELAQRVGLNEQ